MTRILRFTLFVVLLLTACGTNPDPSARSGQSLQPDSPLTLASFTQSTVEVTLTLEQDASGQVYLAATYTPEEGEHLYSKDISLTGVDGLGRPTLLELAPESKLVAQGALTESVASIPLEGSPELLVYPAGPVTLRLAVALPEGEGWFEEQVSVTYMACAEGSCFAPVIGKLVDVRVPGSEEVDP